ncbi:DUF742 domain-containing protein [Nocardioides sp. MAH-18]|uniref:DUF742 domain-containing protein n=1 Tax=Nocardioides agri TaxID=2682843 RepID=A0A6L6XRI8_9ACTN|nr:DUF742 domain-containing protein [Nocardioides sp. CGMCC 1.13656]MVQ49343.1 DUF742 domain-containing protein [Nocardioides sp. MAH-18]
MTPDSNGAEPERPTARRVRPYTITSGRTSTSVNLPVEARLRRPRAFETGLTGVSRQVLDTCDRRSVAEVSALTSMPIGVVRVLLGDLVEQGLVEVQDTITDGSSTDERIQLIERTLRGLRAY